MRFRYTVAVVGCAALTGCLTDLNQFAEKLMDPTEQATIAQTFVRAGEGDWTTMRKSFHESVEDPGSDEVWSSIANELRGAEFAERQLIGVDVSIGGGRRSTVATYEGPTDDGEWYVVTLRLLDGELYGFHVNRSEQSEVEANALDWRSIGLPHLALLSLGFGSIALAILASYRVLQSRIPRRRLWAILPFVMVGSITLNWTTGAVTVRLLNLALPPITLMKAGPAAPWLFGFGLPVFALVALWKVGRREEAHGSAGSTGGEHGEHAAR